MLLLLCTLCALKLEDEAPNLLVFNEIKEEAIVLEGPNRRTTTKVLDVIPAVAARTQPISSCLLVIRGHKTHDDYSLSFDVLPEPC